MAKDGTKEKGAATGGERAPATLRTDAGTGAKTPGARPAEGEAGRRAEDARKGQHLAGAGKAPRSRPDTDHDRRGSGMNDVVDAAQRQMPGAPDLAVTRAAERAGARAKRTSEEGAGYARRPTKSASTESRSARRAACSRGTSPGPR